MFKISYLYSTYDNELRKYPLRGYFCHSLGTSRGSRDSDYIFDTIETYLTILFICFCDFIGEGKRRIDEQTYFSRNILF